MKKLQLKTKISTIALILLLTISAMLVALPAATAQSDLIMNLPGAEGAVLLALWAPGSSFDIDLNGGPGAGQNISLFAKQPGDADFSYVDTYTTRGNGDLDVYDYAFDGGNGIYSFYWAYPPEHTDISNIESVEIVDEILADALPYIGAVPNPVTVNTPTLFHVGSIYPVSSGQNWVDLTVEVTTPDNQIVILGPVTSDLTGGTAIAYTPTMIGTYSVRTHFPEQTLSGSNGRIGPAGTTMIETYSDPIELVVQEEQLAYYPGREMPDEYWTRPIGGELRNWYTISGHWLAMNLATSTAQPSVNAPMRAFNEVAPESAHVLFRRELQLSGLAGGVTGEHGFNQGDAYEPKLAGAIIIGGILCYNQFPSRGGSLDQTVVAVDLHTGEELWNHGLITPDGRNLRLSFGQVFYWDSYNYHGVFGYIWATSGSDWFAFDPMSGRFEYSMEGVPSGVSVYGPNGEIYRYYMNKNQGIVRLWNSSRVVSNQGSFRPAGQQYDDDDTADGIEWEVEVPGLADLPGSAYKYREGLILGTDFQRGGLAPNPAHMWAVEVTDTGASVMWSNAWTMPQDNLALTVEDVSVDQDLFICSTKETRVTYGFRLSTGAQIWGPTPSRDYHDVWGHSSGNSWDIIAGDVVIAGNYGGTVWAYHSQNGTVAWTYDIVDPYTESLHNNYWRFRPVIVTDGKLYVENTEHNPRDPQPRGAPFVCLNLTTGEKIWDIPYRAGEWSSTAMIGDSIIVVQNTYDQHIYALGKGPSTTTVTASPKVSALGSSVLLEGTVMDIAPGTEDPKITLRFPNGVAAVSDASMTDWMTYVYNQFTRPANTVGVQVKLEAYDPNGNYQNLGTTTSDANGVFGLAFEPEVPGTYWISATFEGSNGYYGSTISTYITVDPAPTPATPIEPEEPETPVTPTEPEEPEEPETPTEPEEPEEPETPEESATEAPLISTEVAILAAVAVACVIGVAAFWVLRKRK